MEGQKKREILEEIEKQETEASESESEVLDFRPIFVFYPDGKYMNVDLGDNLPELAEAAGMHRDIFRRMTYLELMATGSKFMNEFMAALFLPHTNASLFPSVMNILR